MALVVAYKGQQVWLSVIFGPKILGIQYMLLLLRFLRFLRFLENPKKRDFLRFLLCFARFLELCIKLSNRY